MALEIRVGLIKLIVVEFDPMLWLVWFLFRSDENPNVPFAVLEP